MTPGRLLIRRTVADPEFALSGEGEETTDMDFYLLLDLFLQERETLQIRY